MSPAESPDRPPVVLPSGAVLRAAIPADVPELLRLVVELATFEKEPDSVLACVADYEAILFPGHGAPTGHAEVAQLDGRLVGMAFWYVTFSTWSGHNGIWLEDLYVEPGHRGLGVGTAMLRRLAGICAARGYHRLEWWVLDWNEPAIRFYRGLGARALDGWTHYRIDGDALAQTGGPS
ncbi:MAG TPA: GNAT family N-acetyltransferase [Candidatus Lustribacter sp.]|nr:GNAT family N-acetyltransferase [Candidatus Lustribacter sp.]